MADSNDLHVLNAWLENRKVHAEFKQHPIAKECNTVLEGAPLADEMMPSHQIIASGPHGAISVIRGEVSFGDFEIFCLDGDLFDDIRRYATVKEAGENIHKLLTEGVFEDDDG